MLPGFFDAIRDLLTGWLVNGATALDDGRHQADLATCGREKRSGAFLAQEALAFHKHFAA